MQDELVGAMMTIAFAGVILVAAKLYLGNKSPPFSPIKIDRMASVPVANNWPSRSN